MAIKTTDPLGKVSAAVTGETRPPAPKEGFWNARNVRIAKIFGTILVITLVAAAVFIFVPHLAAIIAGATLFKLGMSMLAAKLTCAAIITFAPTGTAAIVYYLWQKFQGAENQLNSKMVRPNKNLSQVEEDLINDLKGRTGVVRFRDKHLNKNNCGEVAVRKAFEDIEKLEDKIFAINLSSQRLPAHALAKWIKHCQNQNASLKQCHPKKLSEGYTANIELNADGAPIIKGSILAAFKKGSQIIKQSKLTYAANARTGKVRIDVEDLPPC